MGRGRTRRGLTPARFRVRLPIGLGATELTESAHRVDLSRLPRRGGVARRGRTVLAAGPAAGLVPPWCPRPVGRPTDRPMGGANALRWCRPPQRPDRLRAQRSPFLPPVPRGPHGGRMVPMRRRSPPPAGCRTAARLIGPVSAACRPVPPRPTTAGVALCPPPAAPPPSGPEPPGGRRSAGDQARLGRVRCPVVRPGGPPAGPAGARAHLTAATLTHRRPDRAVLHLASPVPPVRPARPARRVPPAILGRAAIRARPGTRAPPARSRAGPSSLSRIRAPVPEPIRHPSAGPVPIRAVMATGRLPRNPSSAAGGAETGLVPSAPGAAPARTIRTARRGRPGRIGPRAQPGARRGSTRFMTPSTRRRCGASTSGNAPPTRPFTTRWRRSRPGARVRIARE